MKREIDVTAYRTVTEFDKDNSLISTVELRVPAEELNYFQDVLRAVDAKKDVRCTLIVRDREELDFDGEPVTPAWVLAELLLDEQAQERMVAEGCPNCAETLQPVDPHYQRAAEAIAGANLATLHALLEVVGLDYTDWEPGDVVGMRAALLGHWPALAAHLVEVDRLDAEPQEGAA